MILPFLGVHPLVPEDAYVAPTAVIIGDVAIGNRSSIWFGTVVRGDVHHIRIGAQTNVQDNCSLHVTGGTHPLTIGNGVSIGHRAVVHGCTVGDRVLVGMGAVVLDGAWIGPDSIVAAGALVPEGSRYPPESVVLGVPARRVRDLREEDRARIARTRDDYVALSGRYLALEPRG